MKVIVQFEAQLQHLAGVPQAEVEGNEGDTVLQSVENSLGDNSDLRQRLIGPDGHLLPTVLIFLNEEPVNSVDASSRQVSDSDTILLLPPISGG